MNDIISILSNLKTEDKIAEFYVRLAKHNIKKQIGHDPSQEEITAFVLGANIILQEIPKWVRNTKM